ncbi:MAG: glycoside hydrolase family 140 protein [Rhodothermales bacterium]
MKSYLLSALYALVLWGIGSAAVAQSLTVSMDGRYLTEADGTPFLWIGDTAWELFHVLTREEAIRYLDDRVAKGFSVIQAVVLAENDGLRRPNAYGHVPFEALDPTRPVEAYFEHVDFIINAAAERGLVVGLLPTWGDKVPSNNPGAGPLVFTPENARVYGQFLGERYREAPIVWILGGDRNIDSDESLAIWNAMAEGLADGDDGRHLMTFHPRGDSNSAYYLHKSDWLDFNMYQSGHARFVPVYEHAERSARLRPRKPFIEGEPAYEDIAVRFWEYMDFSQPGPQRVPEGVLDDQGLIQDRGHFAEGYITDYEVRVAAYWNFLSGAAGFTYGNNAIWQMLKGPDNLQIPALTNWEDALNRPGAQQLRYVRHLFTQRPFFRVAPDQAALFGKDRYGTAHVRVATALDHTFMLVYLAQSQSVDLRVDHLVGNAVTGTWFNPRTGETIAITGTIMQPRHVFEPPTQGHGQDWVLVVDAVGAGLPMLTR